MIDIESVVFTEVSAAIKDQFGSAYVTGTYVPAPSSFPCVSIVEVDNASLISSQDTNSLENHATLLYEVNIYSAKRQGKKQECRAIANVVDGIFQRLGFTRTMLSPMDNLNDATVFRITGRYRGVVSSDYIVYRQ